MLWTWGSIFGIVAKHLPSYAAIFCYELRFETVLYLTDGAAHPDPSSKLQSLGSVNEFNDLFLYIVSVTFAKMLFSFVWLYIYFLATAYCSWAIYENKEKYTVVRNKMLTFNDVGSW